MSERLKSWDDFGQAVERQLDLYKGPRQRGTAVRSQAAEFAVHCMVADTLKVSLRRGWWWTSIEHGGLKDKVTAAKHFRKGVKAGITDLLLIGPGGHSFWLELKVKGGVVSHEQWAFKEAIEKQGCAWAVAYGYDEAIAVLQVWGAVRVSL